MAKNTKAKQDDYRSLDNQALADRIAQEEANLKRLRFGHSVNPIENPLTIRKIRRGIAQLKTEERKRALGS